jgi:hypothetical protein
MLAVASGSMLAVTKGSSAAALPAILAPQDKQKRPASGTVALHAGHFAKVVFPSLSFGARKCTCPEVHSRGKHNATGQWSDAPIEHWGNGSRDGCCGTNIPVCVKSAHRTRSPIIVVQSPLEEQPWNSASVWLPLA